ncbi:MAG: isoleucine--tRNA ligase [Firmicutes bacterium]|nr:isoleucine--tRNA ligase [Bacillota bacterium]
MAKGFDFVSNEHKYLKMWDDMNILQKMTDKNAGGPRFRFQDGPITANATMCMHHVWGRTLKDAQLKYRTLKGHSMHYQNGFDAQGMWVEVEVEKLLGLGSKKEIVEYGLDKFTEKCIERVKHFADMQTRQSIRLGQIMDWDDSHFTNSDGNITAIWHFLKVCHERGWLKKSYKSMPWCPRCGTSLSEHEMSGSYKELSHRAVFVKYPMVNGGQSLLIWTTTPWTLTANVAVAVNPNNDYVAARVKSDKNLIIVGKEAVKRLQDDLVEIVEEFKGSKLLGQEYLRPLVFKGQDTKGKVIPWDAVEAAEGSGLVHIAPGCGAEDFELGKLHNLEPIIPTDEAGVFGEAYEWLNGLDTVAAEDVIFNKLTQLGVMYYTHKYKHNYPFCWRCKTNVIFRLVEGWDIATEAVKPQIFKAIEEVEWQPAFAKKMMVDWITHMGDWNISRRRFYGLPLPFYPCQKCGHLHVIGSKEELFERAIDPYLMHEDVMPHLHRPYIDQVRIVCEKCGTGVDRVTDVGDCWLDAGIMPFSTKQYFTDKKWWAENFPADLVTEMKEQIRLWFYSMLFMSVVLEGRAPFAKVSCYSTMLDEDGKKFSKTGPKNIPFDTAAETFGADSMRYVFASAAPQHDMRFGPSMIDEARRKLMAFLNTVTFYNTYADIDKPNVLKHKPTDLDVTDVWLVEKTNALVALCDTASADHKFYLAIDAVEKFVDDLSNFYIRTNRRRFWKGERGNDKDNAYWALYNAIRAVTVILAPIVPFFAEHVWQTMMVPAGESAASVLLANYPTQTKLPKTIKGIVQGVEFIQSVTTLAHKLRAQQGLKVKQPLRTMYVKAPHTDALKLFDGFLRDELNVKSVEIVTDEEKFNVPYLVVNFKTAGAKLGGDVQELRTALLNLSDADMATAVASFARGKVTVGRFENLGAELFDKKLKSKSEFVSETEGDLTVVLDTTLDEQLVAEGKLRELVRGIQVARQEANLDITARIKLGLSTKDKAMAKIIADNVVKICEEVLATELVERVAGGHKSKAEVDGAVTEISFQVAK